MMNTKKWRVNTQIRKQRKKSWGEYIPLRQRKTKSVNDVNVTLTAKWIFKYTNLHSYIHLHLHTLLLSFSDTDTDTDADTGIYPSIYLSSSVYFISLCVDCSNFSPISLFLCLSIYIIKLLSIYLSIYLSLFILYQSVLIVQTYLPSIYLSIYLSIQSLWFTQG